MMRTLLILLLLSSTAYAQTISQPPINPPGDPTMAAKIQRAQSRLAGCQTLLATGVIPDSTYPPGHRALLLNCQYGNNVLP